MGRFAAGGHSMKYVQFGFVCFVVACVFAAGELCAAEQRSSPSFVVIFMDDLGYADIGPFGAVKQKTPNLDRMAAEGLRLTSFYSAPVCSVARAQLMTGCYGPRVSVPGVYFPAGAQGLNPDEVTIAEYLQQQGYRTACVGKWHLGDQPDFLPTRQGFDQYFGIPYSNDMQQRSAETGERVVPLMRNERVQELLTESQQSELTARYTEDAVEFIRGSADKPFFLYLAHTAVHTPIWPGKDFQGKSSNGRFGDWVEEADWSVGRILEALREQQRDRETLVIFTSDNGPWLVKGADGGSAGSLRGGKGSTWEGGVRVPTVVWWPGKISPGTSSDAISGSIDLLPTLVTLAGGQVSDQRVIDGRDLWPVLSGAAKSSVRDVQYYFSGYQLQAVRQGPWKLALAAQPQSMGQGVTKDVGDEPRLYNLQQDVGERTSVSEANPDIVASLRLLADGMRDEIGGDAGKNRRPAGQVVNPQNLYPVQQQPDRGVAKKQAMAGPATMELGQPESGLELSGAKAPQIVGRPFTIGLTVTAEERNSVIVAQGGSTVGYSLFLRDGQLVFAVRNQGRVTSVRMEEFPLSKSQRIEASLKEDGSLQLQVGEANPVTAPGAGLLMRQPQEPFCIGHDGGGQVADYPDVQPFRGELRDLRIDVK